MSKLVKYQYQNEYAWPFVAMVLPIYPIVYLTEEDVHDLFIW
ncbi:MULTISPECIES: hypothetical protein [Leuconostoc]|nr:MULTISPECIES: hypothetical protein [Leuconostoc]